MTNEDKRRARRFELQLPVTVVSVGEESNQQTLRTKDISSNGMFIELDQKVDIGTRIEMIVDLPQEITQAGVVRLSCLGRVVRVDQAKPSRTGVAVKIERYQFMRLGEPEVQTN